MEESFVGTDLVESQERLFGFLDLIRSTLPEITFMCTSVRRCCTVDSPELHQKLHQIAARELLGCNIVRPLMKAIIPRHSGVSLARFTVLAIRESPGLAAT